MVYEYLKSMLDKLNGQIEFYDKQIEENKNVKESMEKDICKINEKSDLDVEYFSPRIGGKSLRERLEKLHMDLDEIDEKMKRMEEERLGLVKEKEQFQIMLDEVIELKKKANVSRETQ